MPEIAVRPSGPHSVVDAAAETVARGTDPVLDRARARVGTTLRDKWRLDALLGVGGMAAVYAGTHRNGSRAAVKVLHIELSLHPDVRARFLREGYVANAVDHEGAVRVIDDDVSEDGSLFLVTELLVGETLEERRARFGGRLEEGDVAAVVDQLLDVLATAHAKGVVHRDLKPENVYLTRAGQVKVLDFGIARLRELSSATHATKTGATMGTPDYMPPEQARGLWDEVDGASDLWAVGATMFTLLAGRSVHEGRTANEVLLAAMTRQAPPLAAVAPGVSPAIAHVVDVALAFERGSRWADARAMQRALRSAHEERHGAPIARTAPLAVPAVSSARTAPSAVAPSGPPAPVRPSGPPAPVTPSTPTARLASEPPPLSFPSSAPQPVPRSRAPLAAAAAAAVLLLAALAAALGVTLARRAAPHAEATARATDSAFVLPAPASPPDPPAASQATSAPSPPPPPLVAPTDLPAVSPARTAPAPRPARAAAATTRAAAAAPATPATAAAAPTRETRCSPPFVVDPVTQKKTWKEECL